jgi:hypothetical protein
MQDSRSDSPKAVSASLQVYLAEYQALTTRNTYWMTLQYALFPILLLFLAIVAQMWETFDHKLLVWLSVCAIDAIFFSHYQAGWESYNNILYLETTLRKKILELLGNRELLGYEAFLKTQRGTLVWWEPPAAAASLALLAIASFCERPLSTIDYGGIAISALLTAGVVWSAVRMIGTRLRFSAAIASTAQGNTATPLPAPREEGPKEPRSSYGTLMVALFYPAVVGTGFVLLLQKMAADPSISLWLHVTTYFAIVLLFYTSITFLVTEELAASAYGLPTFALDSMEIFLILLAFWFLGFPLAEARDLRSFYLCIALMQVVHILWRLITGGEARRAETADGGVRGKNRWLVAINAAAFLFFTLGPRLADARWFDPAAVAFMAVMLVLYRYLASRPASARTV